MKKFIRKNLDWTDLVIGIWMLSLLFLLCYYQDGGPFMIMCLLAYIWYGYLAIYNSDLFE